MRQKIKNLLFGFRRLNKPTIFFGLSLIVTLGLVLPFHSADAFIFGLAWYIGLVVLFIMLHIATALSAFFLYICGQILSFVLSENFMSIPYTKLTMMVDGQEVDTVVGIGWRLVRDFTNMGFILVLVFIALATILRLSDYRVQKTLPTLIIIALLINFTPIICGAIVDVSNIVMNFFLKDLTGWKIASNNLSSQWNILKDQFLNFFDIFKQLGSVIQALTLLFTNVIMGLIFLLYAFIFVLRYVAIWILVILSPLAFFSLALPATKKIWNQWWQQFIQWCFIGVYLGFFFYLSEHVILMFGRITSEETWGIGIGNYFSGIQNIAPDFFGTVLTSFVAIIFMLAGFVISISNSPSAAKGILQAAQKSGKNAMKWTGGKVWGAAQDTMKTGAAAERVGGWAARKPVLGTIMGKPLLGYAEKRRGELEVGEKEVQSWRSENIAAQIDRMPTLQKAGALKVLAERGHTDKLTGSAKAKKAKIISILKAAKAAGKEKDIIKFLPQYAGDIGFRDKTGSAAIDEALKAQKPEDVAKLDKSIFDIPGVVNRIPHVYSPGKLAKLADHGSETINKVQAAFEYEYKNNRVELEKNNGPGLRYINSVMGNSLFKPVGGGPTPTKIATPGNKEFEDIEKAIKERLKK